MVSCFSPIFAMIIVHNATLINIHNLIRFEMKISHLDPFSQILQFTKYYENRIISNLEITWH